MCEYRLTQLNYWIINNAIEDEKKSKKELLKLKKIYLRSQEERERERNDF